tara:strand:- start:404 stop:1738 length:1335 start_codon:yes stop_codon:yes gene_type:complete
MKYDLIVIGAGSGGVRAARIASVHGAKVAIIENNRFGGTCVNVGCVPKKLYYYLSQFNKDIENYKSYGWSITKSTLNWKLFKKKKDQEILRLNKIYEGILKRNKIDIINGTAHFISSQKIKVGKKNYQAKKFIISTGGKPRTPNISQNLKLINTSDDIFSLKKLPKRMVIEGGGYIAIEFAFIFANLGVKVDLIYRGKKILKSFDSEIVSFLIQSTPKGKIKYHLESQIQKVNKSKNELIIHLSNKKKIHTDYVLSAIGRVANTNDLGLENTNVQLNENKSIKVNRHFQTNDSNIFAVGDVIDYVNLTPVAIRQGHFLADKLFNNKKTINYDFANIPTAVFTSPQIGTVGLTLEMARKNKIDAYELTTNFKSMKKTFSKTNKDTFYKLVIDKKDKTIIGIHIISDEAAELIQLLAVNVVAGNTLDEFRKTVAVHPTSSEEIITI